MALKMKLEWKLGSERETEGLGPCFFAEAEDRRTENARTVRAIQLSLLGAKKMVRRRERERG